MLYEKLVKQGTKVPYLPFSDFGLNKGLYSLFQSPTVVKISVYFWKITVNIVPRKVPKRQIKNTIAHNLNESINRTNKKYQFYLSKP